VKTNFPRLVLPDWFDDRAVFELPYKGFFVAEVELEDKSHYILHFYDPIRLNQELADNISLGKPYFAEQNLILVPEVSLEYIIAALQYLWSSGYFNLIKIIK